MLDSRYSDNDETKRDIPSFIEPRPPLISNPFMRPRPQKGTNLLELFEEDSECEEPELVQVYLRLKPCNKINNLYEVRSDRCLITSLDTTTAGHGRRTQHNVSKMYTFSHIFGPESNQRDIFEHVVKDNLKKLPEGNSFTLLTYGASGSGKTFTLMGTVTAPGLVPRSLEYVFKVVEAAQTPVFKPSESGADKLSYAEQNYELQWVKKLRQVSAPLRDKYRRMSAQLFGDLTSSTIDLSNRTRHYVWVSFIEIYNEGIYDLLAPGDRRAASKLAIREDASGNVYVKGATQAFVKSGEEAYDIMVAGKHNLQVAATGIHAQSSRSHCIFTITMLTETSEGVRGACVRLCDLAGCERAARTRNTGARMHESRAINSSLHVLERCLRTLRRKRGATRTALVPYRESKLTRLLGAGLSGARGEAVSMVVTLNPAPEYAHETRHVLQLAAVAKDIQINNTISEYPSSLESSTQDTTIICSTEVMKLRTENERLHFELVQAQARNRELSAGMEQRQAAAADTMRELVEEAKEISRQYYEEQMQALRAEMDEMVEEYESRLSKYQNNSHSNNSEIPSKILQTKITQLMTEIAILQENLQAEKLARARAEEEVQHLRACIEERDEKSEDIPTNDIMSVTDDSDNSEDQIDPCNESLEPTFTKEDINRSRMLRQSTDNTLDSEYSENVLEKSDDTLKDEANDSINCTFETGDDFSVNKTEESIRNDYTIDNLVDNNEQPKLKSTRNTFLKDESLEIVIPLTDYTELSKRKTSIKDVNESYEKAVSRKANSSRSTYCASTNDEGVTVSELNTSDISIDDNKLSKTSTRTSVNDLEKVKSTRKTRRTFEKEFNESFEKVIPEKISSGRGTYYVSTNDENNSVNDNQCVVNEVSKKLRVIDKNQSKDSLLESKETGEFELNKKHETFVNRIINSFKQSLDSNTSLAQFERLEIATKTSDADTKTDKAHKLLDIEILKNQKKYFDEESKSPKTPATVIKCKEKKIYFDNIDIESNRKSIEVESKTQYDYRSPSIVKDDVATNFEPTMIKKLLGDSVTRQADPIKSIQNKFLKKAESIDMFESPQLPVETDVDDTETVRKSVANFNISDNTIQSDVVVKTEYKSDRKSNKDGEINEIATVVTKTNVVEDKFVIEDENNVKLDCVTHDAKRNEISPKDLINDSRLQMNNTKVDNTIEEFENIYRDITVPRATEFDLLVSQEISESNIINENNDLHITREIKESKIDTNRNKKQTTDNDELKYNLRNKSKIDKAIIIKNEKTVKNQLTDDEILIQSLSKCESKPKTTKRTLRLRRRNNHSEENADENNVNFKDVVNLQKEFSDITMDVPAQLKEYKDIPSPGKVTDDENLPPIFGIQSCPSKSITRSRRKLFTPRAEPLEESEQTGDSNERAYVLRPSYHRPRARRKL